MKKLITLLFILSFNISFAQREPIPSMFSKIHLEALAGINFNNFVDKGGSAFVELTANLIHNIDLNFSLGYTKSFKPENYNIKTYREGVVNNKNYYWTDDYYVTKKGYDIFPISLGVKYILINKIIKQYLLVRLNYNFIDVKIFRTPGYSIAYDSFEAVPEEYKEKYLESHPSHSEGIILGGGITYPLSTEISFDLRYFYKIDNKIINTHNLVIGISF